METEKSIGVTGAGKKWVDIQVGSLPLPVYLCCALVVLLTGLIGGLPQNMLGGFAVILCLGWLLGTTGSHIPILKNFGGPAIFSLLIPSILVFYDVFNANILASAKALMKDANFLYFYIACLVCGSILGMHRKILIQGLMRMIVPMLCGMVLAMLVGTSIALLFGYDFKQALFFVVTPVLAGGIGEGILPLSIGYSEITGISDSQLVAQLIPGTIVGNFFAITLTAIINRLGEKHPHLSGQGQLVKVDRDDMADALKEDNEPFNITLMGGGRVDCLYPVYYGDVIAKTDRFSRAGTDDHCRCCN